MSLEIRRENKITFFVQDKPYTVNVDDVTPNTSLLSYIRNTLQLTGTKSLCHEGGCGACIVVLYAKDFTENEKHVYLAVNACLISLLSCNGWRIYTVEGIGNGNGSHPIQKVLAKFNGSQCGYCSPGMVMNMYALYKSGKLNVRDVENSFGGNICRCTGYRSVLSAFKSLCVDEEPGISHFVDIEDILNLCRTRNTCGRCLRKCDEADTNPIYYEIANSKWIKVYTLHDLLAILNQTNGATYRLVAGNTAKGISDRYGNIVDIYIDVTSVPDLKAQKLESTQFILGANTTLARAIEVFTEVGEENSKFRYLTKFAQHIDLVANIPVRNVGTIAGNLMIKHDYNSFPSDIFILLETIGALLIVVGTDGRETHLTPCDFIKYDMNLKVLKSVSFPSLMESSKFIAYKIMPRAQNSHAFLNAGFLFEFNVYGTLQVATIVYGNISPTFIHATKTEKLLARKNLFDNATLKAAYDTLLCELIPDVRPAEPSPAFRKHLAVALFYKAVLNASPRGNLLPRNVSGGDILRRPISTGVQDYETEELLYPLTEAIPKKEALAQTSGKAMFIQDMPNVPHQLHGVLVLAKTSPNSTIKSIDASKALEIEGIVAFYSQSDIPGDNNFTPFDTFVTKEEIFCSGRVLYYQQPIGILVGNSEVLVREAATQIEAEYEFPDSPPLLSVRQVLAAGRTDRIQKLRTIDPTRVGKNIKRVVKGSFDVYHQYHFHMETQCCVVVPNEDGLDIYPSTQWIDQIQMSVAKMLNISNSKINVTVRRLGGAFGGKMSRNGLVTCAAALAAWKLKQPVKLSLSLTENMVVIGKRWPLSTDYEVGLDHQGLIQYLTCTHYTDLGAVISEIGADDLLTLFTANYVSDTFKIDMNVATTDTHNNTWCRAPGSTEGLAAIESIMEHCAYEMGVDPLDFKIMNMPANSPLLNVINDLKTWADIDKRKQDILIFNTLNRWKKKGMSIVPMTYYLSPKGPLAVVISIFHGDGSVQISHGGIEMGQGINTKAVQVCAFTLGVPLDKISVIPSTNFNAPNNTATGGSVTSEAVCYGVMQACNLLLSRIEPYKRQNPNGQWEQWIKACFDNCVHLSAVGLYSPCEPDVGSYWIYGACATEVIVDILTGQHLITRVDLIEDAGQSISPLIDVGQVEGAFVMGIGYFTLEKIIFDNEGRIVTNNTRTYFPPGPKDIPVNFRVKFPKNHPDPATVLKAKATGEPPLCMAVSVPLAIRNAVAFARMDAGAVDEQWFPFAGATTVENIFMNSKNDSSEYVL